MSKSELKVITTNNLEYILGMTTHLDVFKSSQKPLDFGVPTDQFEREARENKDGE